jgi:hypothetical protein
MKHCCFTALQSTIDSQPSGLNAMNRVQSVEGRNGQLASVLWDGRDIIFIEYLEKGQTINSVYYIAIFECFTNEIKIKRPHLKKKKALFHQEIKTMHRDS